MPRSAGDRPLGTHDDDQGVQEMLIVDTGNEATNPDEEAILAELYGEPDSDGAFRGVAPDDRG